MTFTMRIRERRRHPRVPCDTRVDLVVGRHSLADLHCHDLSEGGMQVVSSIPPRHRAEVAFGVALAGGIVRGRGEVVRVVSFRGTSGYTVGIRFVELAEADSRSIARYVETAMRERRSGVLSWVGRRH